MDKTDNSIIDNNIALMKEKQKMVQGDNECLNDRKLPARQSQGLVAIS